MKFYIASGFDNIEVVREVSNQLKDIGYVHTYDWTLNGRAKTLLEMKEIGQKEKQAVQESDFIAVILPGGKGTHIELGMAIALSKRIYLYSPNEDIYNPDISSTFYQLSEVQIFIGKLESYIEFIISEENKFKQVCK